ncbi:MAG: TIR domain-containing protein [Clostridia bacterium]|nr:TIR domain-containing protein [Clostridia bacterium]
MAVFKCKMCGGELAVADNSNICVCDYCGTKQTVPSARDEILSNLFNRANNLRLRSEFDKAQELYEKIVAENPNEAEAYWGLVLCKYGIEYVEDPATKTRIPTCHRTQLQSILADGDYKSAIANADVEQKAIYEEEAGRIDEIQKDILKIVHNEKPFDVFICYKETDENGKRTLDSSIANDIYHQLTQEGFKVFYAAITLEDKLGQEYEPYIFAALNSAKTMLVLGTKPEYFTAVWVRNEWSRFMKLMQNDRSKLLIPCYRDMDAYDLPEEFAHLQAQDMGKIGFINDIVRGIKKVTDEPKTEKKTAVVNDGNANIIALKKRGFMALEDGEWDKADGYFDDALNIDAEDAECYLGKLMAELQVRKREDLRNCKEPFENSRNYQKAIRFGDEKLKREMAEYIEGINQRKLAKEEAARLETEKKIIQYNVLNKRCTISAGSTYTVGLKSNGTVVAVGSADKYDVLGWRDIVAISAGRGHIVGLKSDGTVVATGDNNHGECDVSSWHDIVAISTELWHTVGLKSDGTVIATKYRGSDSYHGQCDVYDWCDIIAISTGAYYTVGLKSDGTVVAVGENDYGQCDVSHWTNIVSISAGSCHTIGLKSDGTVIATNYKGDKEYYCGECDVSEWSDIVSISAGQVHTVGLKSDGTVIATKYTGKESGYTGQCNVFDWTNIVSISAGLRHTVGLKSDGTVVATNYYSDGTLSFQRYQGQCDVSDWKNIALPPKEKTLEELFAREKEEKPVRDKATNEKESDIYNNAVNEIAYAEDEEDFLEIANLFKSILDYKDAKELMIQCKEKAVQAKQRGIERAKYIREGRCKYCGGRFQGLFSKTCTKCGRKKDY